MTNSTDAAWCSQRQQITNNTEFICSNYQYTKQIYYSETGIKRPSTFVVFQDRWSLMPGRINMIL